MMKFIVILSVLFNWAQISFGDDLNQTIGTTANGNTIQDCQTVLGNYLNQIKKSFKSQKVDKTLALQLIEASSKNRITLRNQWVGQPQACVQTLLDIIHLMRDQEDFWALAAQLETPIESKSLNFSQIAIPLKETNSYLPYQSASGFSTEPAKFNNGDVMITKGLSWVSSAISQAASDKTQFSHAVFVYVDKNNTEHTIEAYIGKGVSIYPMTVALKNENSRIQHYRPRDSDLGNKAGNYVYDNYIVKRSVGYDYTSNFNNDNELTCAEIPYWAYRKVSNDNIIIPSLSSTIKSTPDNMLSELGIPSGKFFSPGDFESDSRFDLISEWTDYRLLQENVLKDAVMNRLFEWTTNQGYHYTFSSKSFLSKNIIYFLRKSDLIWRGVEDIFHVTDFPKEMPQSYIEAITTLSESADFLYEQLKTSNETYKQIHGYPMTKQELIDFLDFYRKQDEDRLNNGEEFYLHKYIERN